MNILVAVDGSEFTDRVLSYLGAHPIWSGASNQITITTVVPAVMGRAASMFTKDTLDAYYHDEAEAVFSPVRRTLEGRGQKATYRALIGSPGDEIAEEAARGGYALVVMGSHGHGSLGNLVLGSVATKVLARCKVPVLLVR